MRKKLTFAVFGLALTAIALRPVQAASAVTCVTYYCTDTGCCYSCCFIPNRAPICTEPCAPVE